MKPRVIHRAGCCSGFAATDYVCNSSIYSLLLEQGIDAFWLLKIHTGRFELLTSSPITPGCLS